jgi:hypothetical protein
MMSKKQDLKLVFDFIADFLREDVDVSPAKATPVEEEPKPVEIPKSKMEQLIDSINPQEVRSLIQRVDDMDKPTFMGSPIIGDHQRNFEAEFKKMVKDVDKLTKEKEDEKKNVVQDAVAASDFNVIKTLRNNVTAEEREAVRPSYNSLHEILRRANPGPSFSG